MIPVDPAEQGEPWSELDYLGPVDEVECCASGSCEVCRRPQGYSRGQREQLARDFNAPNPCYGEPYYGSH